MVSASPCDPVRCRDLGVAGSLTKPVTRADLRAAIVRALDAGPVRCVPPPTDTAAAVVQTR